jgi:hypothetical protein
MTKHRNRDHHADRSQRPAQQQVAVRPAGEDEAPQDTVRVPSPATADQAVEDASAADPDRYRPGDGDYTGSDPLPGEATDVLGEDDDVYIAPVVEAADEPFTGFQDDVAPPALRGHRPPQEISLTAQQRLEADNKLVPILPRRTVMRTYIGNKFWNFYKGQEQFVPASVRDHLQEKGVI